MDVSKIITLSRKLTHKTQAQVSDSDVVDYLNIAKDDFWTALITAVWENYHWTYWNTDIVNWQNEYIVPEVASDEEWVLKLSSVSICYDWNTYDNWKLQHIKAREESLWSLKKDMAYYENYSDYENPIYTVNDNSIFIFPAPKKDITDGIKLSGIRNIKDYTETTTEAEMVVSPSYHKILLQWILPYIYKANWELDKYNLEMSEYERMKRETIRKLSDRVETPFYAGYPNNNEYSTNI